MEIFAHVIVVFCPSCLTSVLLMGDSNAGFSACVWSQQCEKLICFFVCLFVFWGKKFRIWCSCFFPQKMWGIPFFCIVLFSLKLPVFCEREAIAIQWWSNASCLCVHPVYRYIHRYLFMWPFYESYTSKSIKRNHVCVFYTALYCWPCLLSHSL